MRKFSVWLHDTRALSPIFATVLLASIIILFGSVAYYYSSNLTSTATNNYIDTISASQQSLSERVSFENVIYSESPPTLTIYIINSGIANNVKINSMLLYNANRDIVGAFSGTPNPISTTKNIDDGTTMAGLNAGKEGYFTISLGASLASGSYTIHLITQSGSAFDYEFIKS